MHVSSCLCVITLAGGLVAGPGVVNDRPRGRPPLVMEVVEVGKDHLVLEHVGHKPDKPHHWTLAWYQPALRHLCVFDKKGHPLAAAEWKKRIKVGLRVYVAPDEKKVDPGQLRTAAKDALVLWGVVRIIPNRR